MGILIKQDDGQLIPYTEINHGWSNPKYGRKTTYSVVIDRNGSVAGLVDSEGKPVPMSNLVHDHAQNIISADLYGLKRGNPDLFNPVDQLRTRTSVRPQNPYVVGSSYAPNYGPMPFLEDKLMTALENGRKRLTATAGLFGENPQPQAPVRSAGKPRKVRKGRNNGNLSGSGSNTYASAGIPKGGVVSPATMMRTSGVQPVQAAYGNNAPMGEGFDYTRTYDPMSNSMRSNDSYSYYDPSRNAPSGGDGTDLTLTYDPMTGQMVRR